ncbi:acyl-CoA dehydrogenase [Betaproteobacteria bacterium]|nr:acyl-CoA dehydrogenase [Betaproteobacteria bacterium]GHU24188.1 acyl-CoA dehydrogenase [Betaproteobacteria bacterium]GHU27793.1 acyl-CoA dehydrogenase [Betaproteobacteria bacterium]
METIAAHTNHAPPLSYNPPKDSGTNVVHLHLKSNLPHVLETVRKHLAQTAAQYDEQGTFPFDNFRYLHTHGLLAAVVPQEYGGSGFSLAQAQQVITAVAYAEPSTALVLTMSYLQHRLISRSNCPWPHATRLEVLQSAVAEGALINILRAEPELGTPARGGLPATILRRSDQGWLLSGRKIYSTGSPALRWQSVWVRTDEPQARIGVVLTPGAAYARSGVHIEETWNHLGLRASGSHDVVFDNLPVPDAHVLDLRLPQAWGEGGSAQQQDLDANRDQQAWMAILVGSIYQAVAQAGYEWLLGFLNTRTPSALGVPLATLPRVQHTVGEIALLLNTGAALVAQAVQRTDAGTPPDSAEVGQLKTIVTNNAVHALERALQLSGNHGLSRHNPLERHYRDALCGRIHTPQDDSVFTALGQQALQQANTRPNAIPFP